jgi:hypothetical protein
MMNEETNLIIAIPKIIGAFLLILLGFKLKTSAHPLADQFRTETLPKVIKYVKRVSALLTAPFFGLKP